ncbi:MAG: DUF2958 domain-containing protein [Proteobacteria bacterium]|nr:DUF2958 domain-containing protein [Pseudomonadota bacterium]
MNDAIKNAFEQIQRNSWDGNKFIPKYQTKAIKAAYFSEDSESIREAVRNITKTANSMPVTYEQDGMGDNAVAFLHYFAGGMDWYITELDMTDGVTQAFGYADLGYGGELGYISITELCNIPDIEIDLYWKPQTLSTIKMAKIKGHTS